MSIEITRKRSNKGVPYRIMDDIPSVHCYCIEYAKTFMDEGEIIYGWFPLFEPKNKTFTSLDEVKELFNKQIQEN